MEISKGTKNEIEVITCFQFAIAMEECHYLMYETSVKE